MGHFALILTTLIVVIGAVNGFLTACLYRKHKAWFPLTGALLNYAAVSGYFWYASAYLFLPEYTLYAGYVFCAWIVGQVLLPIPLLVLTLGSLWNVQRSYMQKGGFFITAVVIAVASYGTVNGNEREITLRHDIRERNWPVQWEGFKIAQITDTHIGPYYRVSDLAVDLTKAKEEGADMVALTGDLIDDLRVLDETAELLTERNKDFPYGIFYIWGNHEYFRDKNSIEDALSRTPVVLLENEHKVIERKGVSLYIAGVDYPWGDKDELPRLRNEMADRAFSGIPDGEEILFLAHHPDFLDNGFEKGAFLTLAGHTHGGQAAVFGKPIFHNYAYMRGEYDRHGRKGYVSVGTGGWFPFRLDTPRELTIFTLHGI